MTVMNDNAMPAQVRSNDGLVGFPAITEPMRAAGGAVIEQILAGNADPDSTWNDAANVFAAMLAAAPQREPVAGWQPIETAPKDGTLLMLWEDYESEPVFGRWNEFRDRWVASATHYDTDGDACVVDRIYSDGVKHWMPLPEPPNASSSGSPQASPAAQGCAEPAGKETQ